MEGPPSRVSCVADEQAMRIRPLVGVLLSLGILVISAFLIYVGLTSSAHTQPMFLIPAVLGVIVGLFLCVRVPDNNIGLVVLVGTMSILLLDAYSLVREWAVANDHLLLATIASMSGTVAFGGFLTGLVVLLPIWFPDGVAINRWSRWVARLSLFFLSLAVFGALFAEQVCLVSPPDSDGCLRYVPNPWGIPGFNGSQLETSYLALSLLAIPAVISLVLRWHRSTGVERAQLKWFSLTAALLIVVVMTTIVDQSLIESDAAAWVSATALCGVWVSIGFAVTKYRLYDIDRIISRGLGYILVVGILAVVYTVGAVWLPTKLVSQQSPIFVAGATLAVVGMFKPLRARTLRWVDRIFYRTRYDSDQITSGFSATLRAEYDLDQVCEGWTTAVIAALHPSATGIWLKGR